MAAAILLGSIVAGCTGNFEEYNRNPKEPTSVPTSGLLNSMIRTMAYHEKTSGHDNGQGTAQFLLTFWAAYSGQVTATHNWNLDTQIWAYYNPPTNWRLTPSTELMGAVYPNLYFIEDRTNKEGVIYAVALVTKVHHMHIIASAQGPMPYTKIENGQIEAGYDTEEVVWQAMFDDLDRAIAILKGSGTTNADLATVDDIYGGNVTKWLKFANTLKLRMAIRVSSVAEYARQKAEEAVRDGVMTDNSDSAWVEFAKYGITNQWAIGWLGKNDDCEARPNACLVSWMNGYNDPRREKYFTNNGTPNTYVGAISGPANTPTKSNYTSGYSHVIYSQDNFAAQPVMYAAEAAFLRAEGAWLGWSMGNTPQELYHEGIKLALNEFGCGNSYASYIETTTPPSNHQASDGTRSSTTSISVKWNDSDRNKQLEQILTQKWIALYLDPMNGWADYRRTGYPKIWAASKSANDEVTTARGARRTPFSQSEYNTNNANVQEAAAWVGGDSMGYDLWWALKN